MKHIIFSAAWLAILALLATPQLQSQDTFTDTLRIVTEKSVSSPADILPYEKEPTAVKQVQPKYPESAIQSGTEGTVYVKVLVRNDGKVGRVVVLKSDNSVFDQLSIDAAMQWEFTPLDKGSDPDGAWVAIPFRFRLNTEKSLDEEGTDNPPIDFVEYDVEPRVLAQAQPEYPESAMKAGTEGTVYLKVWVGKTGKVKKGVVLKSDNSVFDQAAKDACMKWAFEPAMKDGKPVDVWVAIPFRFRLKDKDAGTQGK
jgi:TonB family protein